MNTTLLDIIHKHISIIFAGHFLFEIRVFLVTFSLEENNDRTFS